MQNLTQLKIATEEENEHLHVQLEKTRTDLREVQKQNEDSSSVQTRSVAEKLALKQKIAGLEETLKSLQETIDLRKETSSKLEAQLMDSQHMNQELQEENARLHGNTDYWLI